MLTRQTILVVEDEPAIADTIRYALETEGFVVRHGATGSAALARFAEGGVALVVLDVGLPDMHGFDVCREMRRDSSVPVIFLTARAEEVDRVSGLELGADDYMVKPFSPRELSARVRAVLRRTPALPRAVAAPAPSVPPPEFAVDEERFEIRYLGQGLDLVRTEYRLLRVLLGRRGRVYTREDLLAQAWDEPEASMDRTVDTHIKTLRAKLRRIAPDRDPIRTHRGIGYSVAPAEGAG